MTPPSDRSQTSSTTRRNQATYERLINLVLALKDSSRPLNGKWLIEHVSGYEDGSPESRRRKLNRDIAQLRDLGFDIDANDDGYLMDFTQTVDVHFTQDEMGVIALASQFALSGDLAALGRRAWVKLSAAGSLGTVAPIHGVPDSTDLTGPDFSTLLRAITESTVVQFLYYPSIEDEPSLRAVEPWALVPESGRWYFACFDRDREKPRSFRLARINSIQETDTPATHIDQRAAVAPSELVRSQLHRDGGGQSTHAVISVSPADSGRIIELLRSHNLHAEKRTDTRWVIADDDAGQLRSCALAEIPEIVIEEPGDYRVTIANQLKSLITGIKSSAEWTLPSSVPALEETDHSVDAPAAVSISDQHHTELLRLLTIVPYLRQHPGVTLFEAAHDLAMSPTQLKNDITTLTFCGLPGLSGGDLIDIDADPRHISLWADQGLTAPVGLTMEEASAILMALETIDSIPGIADADVIHRTEDKLRTMAGNHADAIARATQGGGNSLVNDLADAVNTRTTIAITYADSLGDAGATPRLVDPLSIMVVDGVSYLRGLSLTGAHDHADAGDNQSTGEAQAQAQAQGNRIRHFRIDRIQSLEQREPSTLSTKKRDRLRSTLNPLDPFGFGESSHWARVWVAPEARWVVDYEHVWPVSEFKGGLIIDVPGRPEWIHSFILRHGGSIIPLEPTNLRNSVRDRAEDGLLRYR